MKKKLLTAITVLMLTAVLLCTCVSGFDANDYDYGGNDYSYDYGGSSWDYDDDDDYYSGSYGGGGGSDMTWEETLITIAIVTAALVFGGLWARKPLKSSGK